jgi:hypothetical protein
MINLTPVQTRRTRAWWSRLRTRLVNWLTTSTVPQSSTGLLPTRSLEPRIAAPPIMDPQQGNRTWPGDSHRDHSDASRRSQDILANLTRQGFHVGIAPYGYTISRSTIVDDRGRIRNRSRLVPDPVQAAVVRSIFHWRVIGGLHLEQILRRLNSDHRRYPPPPARHPDRPAYWRAKTLAGLLSNPKYTGFQVSNHRDHNTGLRPVIEWVCSERQAHHPLISPEMFWAAQNPTPESVRSWRHRLLAAQGRRPCD